MQRTRPMRTALFVVAVVAISGCADEPWDDGDSAQRGGWDRNSGSYSGNLGSFGGLNGLRGSPTWGATGPGTLNNATIYGIQYDATVPATCAAATPGITDVRFLSSSGSAAAAIGPDVEVTRTGVAATRLAMGEEITFPGTIYDGYLGTASVVFRLRRVDTLVLNSALWYEWPIFALESCDNAAPPPTVFAHHGYVTWAPMIQLPELPGESFMLRSDIVQAVTTVPRVEYVNNPNVPVAVARQTGSLWFKFAFYASLPIALHGESALDLVTSTGATIANGDFLWRGALALGNASKVTLPPSIDPQQHEFYAFFTRDGTPIAMFALGRGAGAAASVRLPPSWGGDVVGPLELSDDERAEPGSLDSVQAVVTTMPAGDRMAASDTHLGSGTSQYRAGLYAAGASSNFRYRFYQRWRSNAASMQVSGLGVGRIASQVALEAALGATTTPVAWAVACESPIRGAMSAFEQPNNWLPIPNGSPIVPTTIDAGMPDGAMMFDARLIDAPGPIDAGVDALPPDAFVPPDAAPDAFIPPDAFLPPDAAPDAFIPPDAFLPPDATPPDAFIPPDAFVPPDALNDATSSEAVPCFAPC